VPQPTTLPCVLCKVDKELKTGGCDVQRQTEENRGRQQLMSMQYLTGD
jgi:hypothetical protein